MDDGRTDLNRVSERGGSDCSLATEPSLVVGVVDVGGGVGVALPLLPVERSELSQEIAAAFDANKQAKKLRLASSRKPTSYELRRIAKESLDTILLASRTVKILGQLQRDPTSDEDDASEKSGAEMTAEEPRGILRSCCLGLQRCLMNPRYRLRSQMLLTFGTVSAVTILIIVVVSGLATLSTGEKIKSESESNAEKWVKESLGDTVQYVAEAISPRLVPADLVRVMHEFATGTRFYPMPWSKGTRRLRLRHCVPSRG